jgi:DNA adenine methylase
MQTGTFPYPGSKTTYASWIIDHFPEHHLYVEPFGGAASVLVAKPRSDIEVYNDINGDCVDFFKAVRDKPDELARWVEYTPYSRELFDNYVESYPDWPDNIIERAGRFLFVQSACFGSKGVTVDSPTFNIVKGDSVRSDDNSVKWDTKGSHINKISKRFKRTNIEQLDYAELVKKYDHADALFYFDPPYIDVGDSYYQTESGGFDHDRFVNTLHEIDAKWVVSYDENIPPSLSEYHTVSRTKVATMSAQTPEKVETLTMNYDPNTTPNMRESNQQGLEAYND